MHLTVPSPRTPSATTTRERRRQRTRELLDRAHDASSPDERKAALDEVVCINMEVARTLAAPYAGRGIPLEDLEQVAYMALVRATHAYEPGRAPDFLAYVVPTVRGEVKKHFRDHGWTVRPPRRIQELQARVFRTRAELEQTTGHPPATSDLAAALEEPESDVVEALGAGGCFTPTSLDQPVRSTETGTSLVDLISRDEDGFDAAEARAMLAPALRSLPPRDRAIVTMRFFEGLTQREIGTRIGVTQMQVSRLLSRILADLRDELQDVGLPRAS